MLGIPFLGETANRQVETLPAVVDMSDLSQALDALMPGWRGFLHCLEGWHWETK